jgi:hypothetical protein
MFDNAVSAFKIWANAPWTIAALKSMETIPLRKQFAYPRNFDPRIKVVDMLPQGNHKARNIGLSRNDHLLYFQGRQCRLWVRIPTWQSSLSLRFIITALLHRIAPAIFFLASYSNLWIVPRDTPIFCPACS